MKVRVLVKDNKTKVYLKKTITFYGLLVCVLHYNTYNDLRMCIYLCYNVTTAAYAELFNVRNIVQYYRKSAVVEKITFVLV
jgi:hypothetical protein